MKKYSSKRSVQILAHVLKGYGINNIVISPGSRNAPIAIHFSENEHFSCYSIIDERSAGFVALGMAQSEKMPVAVTCTSGSAAANYYPAVTEAFYANVPLLILSADRPTDYIDIFDGQTIRQNNLFQQHSYGDFELREDDEADADDYNLETVKKAVELCIEKQGPVHINIPLGEPLYNLVSEIPQFPQVENTIQKRNYELPANLIAEWNTSKRILILVGTLPYNQELEAQLSQIVKNHSAVVLSEVNSNLHHDKFFVHIDRYIFGFGEEEYRIFAPDLVITVGQNVVSKKMKQFLRKVKPNAHWHVDAHWHPDTFFYLTQKIEARPEVFFGKLLNYIKLEPQPYFNLWDNLRQKKDARHQEFLNKAAFSDFSAYKALADYIPENYAIHFSNSAAIRYAQLFDFHRNKIYCNRGTSGIDGSTSTAMGFAVKSKAPTVLVTGDIGFFYDINGLWNQYIPPFTRIILMNNGEGNIFKIIPGPENANENVLDEFITTKHHKNAEFLAKHFGFGYVKVDDELTLDRVLENFFKPDVQPKILEICTQDKNNAEIQRSYFEYLSGEGKDAMGSDN